MPNPPAVATMLYEMCHSVLTTTDIRAICKARGFSDAEVASRSLFEHVFPTATGVEAAVASLSDAERAALYLLRLHGQPVDVTFFSRLYGDKIPDWGTFNQRFKPIHEAVQKNLVRKGVLLISALQTRNPDVLRITLWRYAFPPEFARFLPAPVQRVHLPDATMDRKDDPVRLALRNLVQGAPHQLQGPVVRLGPEGLVLAGQPFTVSAVQAWRQSAWEVAMAGSPERRAAEKASTHWSLVYDDAEMLEESAPLPTPFQVLSQVFSSLEPQEWIEPSQLEGLLTMVYGRSNHPHATTLCKAGWKSGWLARYLLNGTEYYRAAATDQAGPADETLEQALPVDDERAAVDVVRIPYSLLEFLNTITEFSVTNGRLLLEPRVERLAQAWDTLREHPVVRYLRTHDAVFRATLKRMDAQWGKLLLHENLLVARISDLSLQVAIRQALGAEKTPEPRAVFLDDGYLVFPRNRLADVEKLVKKAGHVIKTVHAS